MVPPPTQRTEERVDKIWAEILRCGESREGLREILEQRAPDDLTLVALLRRAVPIRLLEHLATRFPWSERPRVLGAVARNARTPRHLGLKILPALLWRDLADVSVSPWVASPVRARAEGLLRDMLGELRLGDRISLARSAPPLVLRALLFDEETDVVEAALLHPRLREEDLVTAIRNDDVRTVLLTEVGRSYRWRARYAIRVAMVLQRRTPLALALSQVTSLVERDLRTVSEAGALHPLVRAAATRALGGPG